MRAVLKYPALYQAYQNAGGFFGDLAIREDYLRVPYRFIIGVSRNRSFAG